MSDDDSPVATASGELLPVAKTADELARLLCRMEVKLGPPWRIEYGPDCRCMGPGCPWCERARQHIDASIIHALDAGDAGAAVDKLRAAARSARLMLAALLPDLDDEDNDEVAECIQEIDAALDFES